MSGYDASEWKAGDVAMVGWRMTSGMERAIRTPNMWQTESGIFLHADDAVERIRPLVVIDDQDRAAVERLRDLYDAAYLEHNQCQLPPSRKAERGNALVAALRDFARPAPHIEEPQGLGAVVERPDGALFCRLFNDNVKRAWVLAGNIPANRLHWDEVDAVRILSPGLTP